MNELHAVRKKVKQAILDIDDRKYQVDRYWRAGLMQALAIIEDEIFFKEEAVEAAVFVANEINTLAAQRSEAVDAATQVLVAHG